MASKKNDIEERPSKSAKKRESTALQKLGEKLIKLSRQSRDELNLSPELMEALSHLDNISEKEAIRRQKQYIGKLMRYEDVEEISRRLALLLK